MSRGLGRVERDILTLLERNTHLSAPVLSALIYQEPATVSQYSAVRRALARLQKRGLVVKLGSLFHGERCSCANRGNATAIVVRMAKSFGNSSLGHHPQLARLHAEEMAARG